MIEFYLVLAMVFGGGNSMSSDMGQTAEPTLEIETAAAAVTIPSPFPEFTHALDDCLTYAVQGDLEVFKDDTHIMESVGAQMVFYPKMDNPPKFQVAVSQRAGVFSCGGTGAAAPTLGEVDTIALMSLTALFEKHNLKEVKFPQGSRVWADCEKTFVMMVGGAGDIVVLNVSGNEPTAKVYCDAFGVKE